MSPPPPPPVLLPCPEESLQKPLSLLLWRLVEGGNLGGSIGNGNGDVMDLRGGLSATPPGRWWWRGWMVAGAAPEAGVEAAEEEPAGRRWWSVLVGVPAATVVAAGPPAPNLPAGSVAEAAVVGFAGP